MPKQSKAKKAAATPRTARKSAAAEKGWSKSVAKRLAVQRAKAPVVVPAESPVQAALARMEADLGTHRIEGFAIHGDTPFSMPLFSHIEGNLYMGGCPVDVLPEVFQYAVCLYPWEPYRLASERQVVTQCYMADAHVIPDPARVHALAEVAVQFAKLGPTLVHCQAGLNRSGMVTALALMKLGRTADEAIALLRQKRGEAVLCNALFETWLRAGAPIWDMPSDLARTAEIASLLAVAAAPVAAPARKRQAAAPAGFSGLEPALLSRRGKAVEAV